jgi:hypothetical protein
VADKIYKKGGSVISVNILKTWGDTILYQSYMSTKEPVFSILKTDIDAIAFKNGAMNCYTQQGVDTLLAYIKQQLKSDIIPSQRNGGLSANLGGPSLFFSLNMDIFLSPNISLEVGAPLQLLIKGVYGGIKFHLPIAAQKRSFQSFYVGGIISTISSDLIDDRTFAYIPIGFHATYKNGFIFSIELAYLNKFRSNETHIWGQIRLGERFWKGKPAKK